MEYVMQNINAYTGEVIRESSFENMDIIRSSINSYLDIKEKGIRGGIILIGYEMQTWVAEYLSHSIDESTKSEGRIVYKFLFKVKMTEKQIKMKR